MWASHIGAQTITATAGTVSSCPGSVVVPLDVSGFTNVSALSLVLKYDTSVLTYTGYQNLRTELVANSVTNQDQDQFIMSWYSVTPVSLTDGSFIELLFTTNGGISDLVWDVATGGNCEFSDQDGNVIMADFVNGQVYAPGSVAHLYTQPADQDVFEGNDVSFSFSAGGAIAYQWQESSDGGSSWNDLTDGGMYSGTTGSYFTIYGVISGMDGRKYRSIFEGVCPPADTTAAVVLNVNPIPPTITMTAGTLNACAGNITVPVTVQDFLGVSAFSLSLSYDTAVLTFNGYQGLNTAIDAPAFVINNDAGRILMSWYKLTPVDIPADTLVELLFTTNSLSNSALSWDTGTEGSCEIVDENSTLINTIWQDGAVNTPGQPPFIMNQPADAEIYPGDQASFSVNAYSINTYRWQESTDSGSTWTDLADDATYWNTGWYQLTINGADLSFNGNLYRCRLTGPCPPDTVTASAILTVSPLPQIITATLPAVTRCDDTLSVPLLVENFNDVAAISMAINFDTSLLVYTGLVDVHPALAGTIVDNAVNGILYISWASLSPAMAGDTTLLELGFTALQNGYGSLSWNTDAPGNVEFSDPGGNVIQQVLTNGSVNILITAPEEVSLAGLDSIYCINAPVSLLTGTPSGGGFYGPGISGSDFDPAAAGAGTHTITYVYTNVYGCEYPASQQATVLAQPLPVADFSYTADLLELSLTDLSVNATSYLWDFGDGENDTVSSPVHTYASANNYTVLLTAISACGTDTSAQVVVMGSNLPPEVVNPVVDMAWPEDSLGAVIGISGVFSDPDGDTLTYSANSNNLSVVTVSLSDTSLTISTAGVGTATVTVSADDSHGGTACDTFLVQVNPLPPPDHRIYKIRRDHTGRE
jgi:PKD repeat protein